MENVADTLNRALEMPLDERQLRKPDLLNLQKHPPPLNLPGSTGIDYSILASNCKILVPKSLPPYVVIVIDL